MTSLITNKTICLNGKLHTPHKESVSLHDDTRYTFCEVCENNIESWYIYDDYDRLPFWTKWELSK